MAMLRSMAMRCGVLLLLASGCAQLFGIDETSAPDAPSGEQVTLSMQRASIGASLVRAPFDLTGQTAKFLVDDGGGGFTQIDGVLGPADTFSAPILTGTPAALFSMPDMVLRLSALPSRDQRWHYGVFEHPDPVAPLPNSIVMLTVTLPTQYVAAETFRVEVIGAWMRRPLMAADLPTPAAGNVNISRALPYASFTPSTSSPAAKIVASDVALLLRYGTPPATANQLTGVFQAQFEQTDGTDPMNGTLSAVQAGDALSATIDPPGYSARFAAVNPAVTGLGMSWSVNASPGHAVGSTGGVALNSASPAMTDTTINASYGNPFESLDWRAILTFVSSSSRTYMVGTTAVPLGASLVTYQTPGTGLGLTFPVGLPITVRANLTPLTSDGMNLPLDLSKAVTIDAIIDRPRNRGRCERPEASVDERADDGGAELQASTRGVPGRTLVLPHVPVLRGRVHGCCVR
jgi:hypothetical protein